MLGSPALYNNFLRCFLISCWATERANQSAAQKNTVYSQTLGSQVLYFLNFLYKYFKSQNAAIFLKPIQFIYKNQAIFVSGS